MRDGHVTGVEACALPIWGGLAKVGAAVPATRSEDQALGRTPVRLDYGCCPARCLRRRLSGPRRHPLLPAEHLIMPPTRHRSEERRVGKAQRAQYTANADK